MTRVKKWAIPNDWTAEDGYTAVLFCFPNSRQWRGIVTGMVESFGYGRSWLRETGTITDVQEVGRDIFNTMSIGCLDDIVAQLAGINTELSDINNTLGDLSALSNLSGILDAITKCCNAAGSSGQQADDPPILPVISVGQPGDKFPTVKEYFGGKCRSANAIYDTVLETVTWLKLNQADIKAGLFVGTSTALVGGLIAAGPLGWAVALVGGTVTGILGAVLSTLAVSFTNLEVVITEAHSDAVLGLHQAKNVSDARDNFLQALEDATAPITSIEKGLIALMLNNKVLNQLFEPRDDVALYESPSPIVCPLPDFVWPFDTGLQGWVFTDQSGGTQSASHLWLPLEQSIQFHLIGKVGGGGSGKGTISLLGLSIDVATSSKVEVDYTDRTAGGNSFVGLRVLYDDLTDQSVDNGGNTPLGGTLVLTPASAKTITGIEVTISHEEANFDYTQDVLEVRINV